MAVEREREKGRRGGGKKIGSREREREGEEGWGEKDWQ